MNFDEVMELHQAVAAFCLENSDNHPKLGIYDIQSKDEGYVLCIKTKLTNARFLDFLKTLAQENKLELGKFRGYFVIRSCGGWNFRES